MEASPALEEVHVVTIEDQLEYYRGKCKALGWEVHELRRQNERLSHKSYVHKRNIRGIQKALELANARASLAESSRRETFDTWRRADDAATRLAQELAEHSDESWLDLYNSAYDPKLAK